MNKDTKMIVETLQAMLKINNGYGESLNGMCDILENLTHKIIRVETRLSELINKFDMLLAVNKVIDLKDEAKKGTTAYIEKCANEMDEDTNSDAATAKDMRSSLLERSRKSFISIFHREPKNDEELKTFDKLNHKIARLLITGDKDDRNKAISMMNKFIDDCILTDGYLLTKEDIDRVENSINIAGKIANITDNSDEAKDELSNLLDGVADDETTDKIIRDFKNLFGEDIDDKKITVKKITANKRSLPNELVERLVGDEGEKHTLDDGSTIRKVVVDSPEKFKNMMKLIEAASGTEGVDEVLDTLTQLGYFDKDKEDDDDEDAPEVFDAGDVFEINGEIVFNDEAETNNESESETNAEPDANENDKENE